MATQRNWQGILLGRIVANALVGALGLGAAGMLGGAVAGAVLDWLNNAVNATLGTPTVPRLSSHIGTSIGIGGGLMVGFVVGALIFAINSARAKPGRTFEPLRALFARVALGLNVGAIGFCSLFLLVEWARTTLSGKPFYWTALLDSVWLIWGTAALMICGAIAGALSKRNA